MSLAPALDPAHLRRYKDLAVLLARYGRSDLVKAAGLDSTLEKTAITEKGQGSAEQLAKDLEALGPTYIKLGQTLSTRVDLLPMAYLEPLTRLQDQVAPFPFEQVEEIVRQELGVRISKAFASFDKEPLAAASLGQVHRATLRDGRLVAVKVQRPGIRRRVVEDLEALSTVAELLDEHTDVGRRYGLADMVRAFRRSLLDELDYRVEAGHLGALGEALASFEDIVVPKALADYSTGRVLTMTYLDGTRVDALHPLVRLEIDGKGLTESLFRAYLHQVLVIGLFHADPHPGNVLLTKDKRIALLDLGMVGRIPPSLQLELLQLLLAVGEGDGEDAAAIALRIGEAQKGLDEKHFRRQIFELVARQSSQNLKEMEVGRVVLSIFAIAANNGLRIPPQLSVLGKALLNLDQIGRCLDPEFEPRQAIRRYAMTIVGKRLLREPSARKAFSKVLETKSFIEELPGRINQLFDAFDDRQLTIKVPGFDQKPWLDGLATAANRITIGLVTAALIVGAALLMRVETQFTLFGYPGLAILCFIAAAGGGFTLVASILWHERPWKR